MVSPRMPTYAPVIPSQSSPGQTVVPAGPGQSNKPAPPPTQEQRLKPETPAYSPPASQTPSANDLDDAPTWEEETNSKSDGEAPWKSNLPPLPAPGDPLETDLGAPEAFPGTNSRMVQVAPASQRVDAQSVTVINNLWLSTARSSGQRPIEVARVGRGKDYVLVVGSIYGNEPEAVDLMDRFNREIRTTGAPQDLVVLMIRTPNPDGLTEKIRTNSQGVDLNRNFPSTRFTLSPTSLTGTHPASEPETQFMMRVLKEYSPTRVIHVRSSIGNRPLVLVNDRWNIEELRHSLAATADVNAFSGDLKAGSLEEFVEERLGLPLATVLLPPQGFGELPVRDLLKLTTATAASGPARTPPGDAVANSTPASRVVTDGAKGDVDLLPSPSSPQETQGSERGSATRFQELPPPPR